MTGSVHSLLSCAMGTGGLLLSGRLATLPRVDIERTGDTVRLTVVNDPIWDDFAFSRLILSAVTDGDKRVILDLSHIPHLHSPGLANLVQIYVQLSKRGRTVLISHVSDHNRRMLRATQLDQ